MKDTSPEIEKYYHDEIMKLDLKTRLEMTGSMFDSARRIVLSTLPKDLSPEETRVQLFLRFYKNDFSEKELEKIIAWIRNNKSENP
ncbi:MAG: hypothetical protein ABSG15_04945 [FCB group bacterium]|jgi:hypothetical protein